MNLWNPIDFYIQCPTKGTTYPLLLRYTNIGPLSREDPITSGHPSGWDECYSYWNSALHYCPVLY